MRNTKIRKQIRPAQSRAPCWPASEKSRSLMRLEHLCWAWKPSQKLLILLPGSESFYRWGGRPLPQCSQKQEAWSAVNGKSVQMPSSHCWNYTKMKRCYKIKCTLACCSVGLSITPYPKRLPRWFSQGSYPGCRTGTRGNQPINVSFSPLSPLPPLLTL